MEKIFEAFAELILQHGLVGVVIASLLYALYRFVGMYHEVQEKRADDGKQAIQALSDNVAAIRELRETVIRRQEGRE